MYKPYSIVFTHTNQPKQEKIMGTVNLAKKQRTMLKHLTKIPKRHKTDSGLIKYSAVEHYDWRILNGLFQKGYLKHSEYGIEIVKFTLG